jgi:hypothetical protein
MVEWAKNRNSWGLWQNLAKLGSIWLVCQEFPRPLSDIMRTDDAVPVDFLKKRMAESQLRRGFLFWGVATSTSAANIKSFSISWPCGLENCDMQPLQPHHARAGCLMTE